MHDNNEYSIQARDLTRKFGSFTAVDRISFQVKPGAIWGFLGANGAGKSTAMRMLTGLLTPTSGEGWVAGNDIKKESEKVKQSIGYMSQKFALYNDMTVWENIRFYSGIYGLSKAQINKRGNALLEKLEMGGHRKELVGDMPLGWKQKLAFSLANIHQPGIVFLDEPTSGVDPITRRQFWEMIYEEAANGVTIFVTTHYMDEAEYCDKVSVMVEGRIKALDTPYNLKQQYEAETMNDVFLNLTE